MKNKFEVGQNLDGEKVQLTKKGLEELQTKLDHLVNIERPEVQKELSDARAQGDLSENADYDSAKNKQGEVEAEIARLQDVLTRVEIVNETVSSSVKLGSKVTYIREGDSASSKTIQIVGSIESNPTAEIPLVGIDSPIAKALIGAKVNDSRRIEVAKPYKVVVKKIS